MNSRPQRTDLGEGVSSPLLSSPGLGWSELTLGHPRWGPDRQGGWAGAGAHGRFREAGSSAWKTQLLAFRGAVPLGTQLG